MTDRLIPASSNKVRHFIKKVAAATWRKHRTCGSLSRVYQTGFIRSGQTYNTNQNTKKLQRPSGTVLWLLANLVRTMRQVWNHRENAAGRNNARPQLTVIMALCIRLYSKYSNEFPLYSTRGREKHKVEVVPVGTSITQFLTHVQRRDDFFLFIDIFLKLYRQILSPIIRLVFS